MNLAKISTKGQLTLPIEIRKILGVEAGDKVLFVKNEKGEVVIKNVANLSVSEMIENNE